MKEAKFKGGQLVKYKVGEQYRYNHVIDSYYNEEIQHRLYRLNERMAMPVYREEWLEEVTQEEVAKIHALVLAGGKVWRHSSGYMFIEESEGRENESQV